MEFKELTDYCQLLAVLTKLEPNAESVWRSICRSYSTKFNTPLHLCLDGQIDPETILLNLYEDELEGKDPEEIIESLLDLVYRIEDPEYEQSKEEELQDFMETVRTMDLQKQKKIEPKAPQEIDSIPSALAKVQSSLETMEQTLEVNQKLRELDLQGDPSVKTSGNVDFSFLSDKE